jgi:hypothetical protein
MARRRSASRVGVSREANGKERPAIGLWRYTKAAESRLRPATRAGSASPAAVTAVPGTRTGKRIGKRMNMKHMRGRNHRGGSGSSGGGSGGGAGVIRHHSGGAIPLNRNHVFDSSGPDVRVRGTAQQLFEKYLQLGRDATGSGDRVMAESYFQHAEHYFRILNAINQASQQGLPQQNGQLPRRPPMQEMGEGDADEGEVQPPGVGDQPGGSAESREILIAAAPPED